MDFTAERKAMVDSQVRVNDVTDRAIHLAMMAVPREKFCSPDRGFAAYSEEPVVIAGERRLPVGRKALDRRRPERDRRQVSQVGRRPDRDDPGNGGRLFDPHAADRPAGVRRPDDPGVKLPREVQIGDEGPGPRDERGILEAGHAFPDPAATLRSGGLGSVFRAASRGHGNTGRFIFLSFLKKGTKSTTEFPVLRPRSARKIVRHRPGDFFAASAISATVLKNPWTIFV